MSRIATLCSLILLSLPFTVLAETWTVGPGSEYDFALIQDALDAASDGDYIDVSAGTYTEDLTLTKDIILAGNSLNRTAVTIAGNILIGAAADAEVEYLIIDATGKNTAVEVKGKVDLKYGQITNGTFGIKVHPQGNVSLYDQVVSHASKDGLISTRNGIVRIEDSLFASNGRAGIIMMNNNDRLYITESRFQENRVGLYIRNSRTNNFLTETVFASNNVAVAHRNVTGYASDNVFTGNNRNVVSF